MDTTDKKLTSIRLNKNLYKHLQEKAKKENRSVNNYIETLLFEASDYEVPNAETLAAIKEVQDYAEGKVELDGMREGETVQAFLERILNEE